MKTHPIEAAIGLLLIICWAVAVLALTVIGLIRQAPAPAPASALAPIDAPAPAPSPIRSMPAAPIAAAPVLPAAQVLQLRSQGLSQRAIADRLGMPRSRVRRLLTTAELCAS